MTRVLPGFIIVALLFRAIGAAQAPQAAGQQGAPGGRARMPLTSDQVQKGKAVYDASCASCHGTNLTDGIAPSLAGGGFKAHWNGQSPAALRDYVRRQMPPGQASLLTNEQYTNLVTLLLKENGYAPGEVSLPTDDTAVVTMRMQFPGVRGSSGGPLALGVVLPAWPKTPDPTQRLTPVTDEMLRNPAPGDWLTWRRTQDGLGFSPLNQITEANVSSLRLVWSHTLVQGSNLGTPLVHDGVIFVASAGNNIDAIDAKTGELIWTYKPEAGAGASNRNMALYDNQLYLTLGRGSVGALDARTGKLLWESKLPAGASGGPLVVNGKIFQGVGFFPGAHGAMQALDTKAGAPLWRWSAIPKTGEPGGNTWGDIPDDKRNGAGIWTTAYFDHELNLVYFGTANTYDTAWLALPTRTPGVTKQALFTNSTIALNPDTGKVAWYFQHQAGDPFDLDYAFERMILPLSIDGKMTKVLVTMGKAGVLDAVDAATGKYLFSLDAGVQNFITRIDPVTGAKTIDPRLIPAPGEEKVRTVCPNWIGVKNWLPGAINPDSKVAFVAGNESCMDLKPVYPGETAALSSGVMPQTRPVPNSDGRYGRMQAFDLQNRKVLWTERQHAPMTSGVLATAGGVVFSGALDQMFSAYDDKTGKKIWSTRLSDVPSSAPITYMVDGKQYVAMVVGFGSMQSTGFVQLVPDIATPVRPSSSIYVFALP
ncbi:MAG TPA: PQQ-binding-like beta-propeller repeat protein [Vicinamibacterales bacterium]|jgi:alcohol dehydrogenase (cytochrome c)|nr:PQQ-binding-like beta-propeller repeat protein [Vicinamibacterales bacterium]